jgi:signal transduction histidine kinase
MKISIRLFISFGLMALLLVAAGTLSYVQTNRIRQSFEDIESRTTTSIIALSNIKADSISYSAEVLRYNIHQDDTHLDGIAYARSELDESFIQYQSTRQNDVRTTKIGSLITSIESVGDEMIAITKQAAPATEPSPAPTTSGHVHSHGTATHASTGSTSATGGSVASDGGAVMQLHEKLQEFDGISAQLTGELDSEIEADYLELKQAEAQIFAELEATTSSANYLGISALLVAIGVGSYTIYTITTRVTNLKGVANKIARGSLDEQIVAKGSDEITDLASNFEHMRKSMVGMQQEIKERNMELQKVNADLTQANENLKRLDHLKDEFIGVASHELKNPIHPILGYAIMGKEGKIPSDMAFDIISKQATKLKQLANDILDVSRIESNTISYKMEKANIHEILLNTLVAASSNIDFRQVSLNVKVDERNKDLQIMADRTRIAQVFTNIVGNAVKFTKKGEITVETRLNKESKKLEIVVSDTGGGIPQEILPHLFGKFVTKSIDDNNKHGTGLGLFISKAIVAAHGGSISAFNNESGGATFQIWLPAESDGSEMLVPAKSQSKN